MWRIPKGPEPPCLAEVRRNIHHLERENERPVEDPWNEVKDCKDAVRKALLRDQRGLCAYCGGRLMPSTMKIEHFVPQAADRSRVLDWHNLLGCCSGRYIERSTGDTITHCDGHRTPYAPGPPRRGVLNIHPVDSVPETHFKVNIRTKGTDLGTMSAMTREALHDLAELNLNAGKLVDARAEVVRRFRVELQGMKEKEVPRFLRRRYKAAITPGADGLPDFAHVAAEYLLRQLRKRGLAP